MTAPMRTWVVTGAAGAGKSLAAATLAERGVPVVDGDALGHELLERPEIRAAIAARLGEAFVGPDGVDRAALGRRVFGDPAALAVLNGITHGPLADLAGERLAALRDTGRHVLAVFEAAVYFLLPSPPAADMVIVVTAPPELRIARLVARSGGRLPEAEARARVAAQAPMAADWERRADHVISNDGTEMELVAAVRALHERHFPGSEKLP